MNRCQFLKSSIFIVIILFIIIFAFPNSSPAGENENAPLPRYLAPQEEGLPLPHTDDPTHPPEEPVRNVAEWEEVEAIIFEWGSYTSIVYQLIDYVVDVTKAYIVVGSQAEANSCMNYLIGQGVAPLDSVSFLIAPTNSVWIRDYAPWWLWRLESWDRAFYEWDYNRPRPQDDVIPEFLSQLWGIEYYGIDLTHTGGNWLVDGWSRAYCSQLILQENWGLSAQEVTDIFWEYANLDTVPLTPAFFGINHLNMSAKLLNDHTVLVNEYPPGSSHNWAMEATVQVFENLTNQYGEYFDVIRIPTPDWNPTTYSYTNATIAQNIVMVSQYNHPYDDDALEIYRENMPGYTVYGVNCNSIIGAGGAINCINHNIMHPELIYITHAPLGNTLNTAEPYRVAANIISLGDLDPGSLLVLWQNPSTPGWQAANMVNTVGDTFVALIPPCTEGYVDYYIYAENQSGNWTTMPRYGPEAHYSFFVGEIGLELTLTPENPPITIPANGGSFTYDIDVANNSQYEHTFDFWITATLPDGREYGPILRVNDLTLESGASLSRTRQQFVPAAAMPGNYTYHAYVGDYPDEIIAEDSFPFIKSGISDGNDIVDDWKTIETDVIATGITEPAENNLRFDYLGTYPNPFNPYTDIVFELAEQTAVDIKIFDSIGREIAILQSGMMSSGRQVIRWDASGLSSGIYFLSIQSEDVQMMKKMVYLK